MPQILGQGTTFTLPNYVGELFNLTPPRHAVPCR